MREGETDGRRWTAYVSVSVSDPLCIMSVHHCLCLSVTVFFCCVVHVHNNVCMCTYYVCVLAICVCVCVLVNDLLIIALF